jgi:hypothetical protein
MARLLFLIAMLLPVLAGCETQTSMMYASPSLPDTKEGRECLPYTPLGLGRHLDLTGKQAMHRGGITTPQRIEYQVNKFHGVGTECLVVRGE